MYAVFVRKPTTLQEARELIEDLTPREVNKAKREIVVVREIELSDAEYTKVTGNLTNDFRELKKEDGGFVEGKDKTVEIRNKDTGETFLIRTEGYLYPAYVGYVVSG